MHIRPMMPEDIPECTTIHMTAFENNDITDFVTPLRHNYPYCYRHGMLRALKEQAHDVGTHCLVVVTDPDDVESGAWDGKERVTGMSMWARIGKDKTARAWQQNNQGVGDYLERILMKIESKQADLFRSNCAMNYTNRNELRAMAHAHDHFESIPSYWYLRALAVDPAFHRQGIGKMLVQWGMNNARNEGVPAAVISSPMAEALYTKTGFKAVDYARLHPKINTGLVLLYDPRNDYLSTLPDDQSVFKEGKRLDAVWLQQPHSGAEAEVLDIERP